MRRRGYVAEPGAGACADAYSNADADADTDTNSNANTDADADADSIADAERWNDDHYHLRGRVTQDVDRAAGNARHGAHL